MARGFVGDHSGATGADDLALVHRLDGEEVAMEPGGDIEREKKEC